MGGQAWQGDARSHEQEEFGVMVRKSQNQIAIVLKSMEQDRLKLLTRQPFIGMILMSLELVPMPGNLVRTACTDGRRIMMGIHFYATLDLEERLFVMAHEAWHCVLMHGVRCQTRNQHRFNIATDLEIHFVLQKEKMKEPFVLPHNQKWDGLSAEEIYERLKGKYRKKPPKQGNCQPRIPARNQTGHLDDFTGKESEHIHGEKSGDSFDQHVYAKGQQNTENALGGDTGNFQKPKQDASLGDDLQQTEDAIHQPANTPEEISWDTSFVEVMRRIVIQAAQVVERTQGHLPDHILSIVEKLRKPELPWRELLRQFVTGCYGGSRHWLPPERRYISRQLYLPSYRDNRMNAVMAIDTSGSTTDDLPQFFTELSSLLNSFGKYDLTVIQCDCTIQHVESFSDAKRFPRNYQWKSYGHGGTSFVPPFEYIGEHHLKPDIFIYLTDGCGDAPDKPPRFSVMWVLTHDGCRPAPWGRCIKLKQNVEIE